MELERIAKILSKSVVWIIMWVSCSIAVSYGLYLTQNAICLWGLLVPGFTQILDLLIENSL